MEIIEILLNSSVPLLITFREALEAALIVGILTAYLGKIERQDLNKYILIGVIAAVIISIIMGGLTTYVYGGLSGIYEKLFEGLASISATIVLTFMIFWMARNARRIHGDLEEQIQTNISRGYVYGISLLAFVAVAREGLETVLFLTAYSIQDFSSTLIGLIIGVSLVIGISFLMMKGIYRLDLQKFFKYTSIILIVFGAGLLGYGVHELIEATEVSGMDIGPLASTAFDINPIDSENLFHENGVIGSIMKALVGYDGDPEWLRVIVYISYWVIIGSYLFKSYSFSREKSQNL